MIRRKGIKRIGRRIWLVGLIGALLLAATSAFAVQPVADPGGPYTGDEGSSILLDGSGSTDPEGGDLTYDWDCEDDGNWEVTGSSDPTVSCVYTDDGIYYARLLVTDEEFLTHDETALVTVNDLGPTADFSWSPVPGLDGDQVNFSDASTSPVDDITFWSWSVGGVTVSGLQNPNITFLEDGDFEVCLTVTDDDGSSDTLCQTVTIEDREFAVDFSWSPDPQDEGAPVDFTDTSSSDPDAMVSWSWDFAGLGSSTDQNPSYTFLDYGEYQVCLTASDDDGQSDTTCHMVAIDDLAPTADFSWTPMPQDEGSPVHFSDESTSYPDDIVSWSWDFDGLGSSSNRNPSFIFYDNGLYNVCLTVEDEDGSTDTVCQNVMVLDLRPTAAFSYSPDPANEGESIQFTDLSTSDPDEIVDWAWDINGIVVEGEQYPIITFDDDGDYRICLTVTDDDGSFDTVCEWITIHDKGPTAAFSWSPPSPNEGQTVAFSDLSTSSPDELVSWSWDFGGLGSSTEQNPSLIFMDDGVYTVCLTVTDDDGSTDTVCHDVTIADLGPTAAFTWSPDPQDEGQPVSFTDASTSHPDAITAWSWDFGDGNGSMLEDPDHTFVDDGDYNVCLTVTDDDGSTDTVCHEVTIEDVVLTAAFSWSPGSQNEGSPVAFTDESSSDPDLIVGWAWDFGGLDTSTDQHPTFTFDDDGIYTVCLTVTDDDARTDTVCHDVTILDLGPSAAFDWTPLTPTESEEVFFTDWSTSSPDAIVAWAWDFAGLGTSSAQNPSHTFDDDGIYPVCLTVTDDDGTNDTVCHDVTVTDLGPTAAFDWSPAPSDENEEVFFSDGSTSSPDDIVDWAWDFAGLGTSTAENPSYTFLDDGIYAVCLTVTDDDGSTDTVCHDVTVENLPPSLDLDGPADVDEGATYTLSLSDVTDPGDDTWTACTLHWGDGNFEDCSADVPGSMDHIYEDGPNSYTISVDLVDEDGTYVAVDSFEVTVNNVAPDIDDQSVFATHVDENGTTMLSGSFTDPGVLDHFVLTVDWGDGNVEQFNYPAGSDTILETHQYLDDDPSGTPVDPYQIGISLVDKDGGGDTGWTSTIVSNVAPYIENLTATYIDEAGFSTLSGQIVDPGTLDTFTLLVDWGDGSLPEPFNYAAGTLVFSESHQYPDDDPSGTPLDQYTINVTLDDDDTGFYMDGTSLTVSNVAPALISLSSTPYISGTGLITVTGLIVDPGFLDTFVLTVDWADGSPPEVFNYPAGTSNFQISHQYLIEMPADFDITLSVLDDDTGADAETLTIHVYDTTLSLSGLAITPVNEGDTATLSGDIINVGPQGSYTLTVDWGDDTPPDVLNFPAGTDDFSVTHQYDDDNPTATPADDYLVELSLEDSEGAGATGSITVHVSNLPPELDSMLAVGVDENGTAHLLGSFSDDGVKDTFSLVVDWGDGSPIETFHFPAYPTGIGAFDLIHQYLDDHPTGTPADSYQITVTLTDDDTGSDSDTTAVLVSNVAPVVDAGSDITVGPETTVDFSGGYSDVGTLDTHTIEWDFGDGTTGSGTLTPSHDYPVGVYTVTLTVTDDDGGVGSDELIVTVEPYRTYLPLVLNNHVALPDLVVESVIATPDDVQVVVVNQGAAETVHAFWVDVYVDPDPVPTMVNQLWQDLSSQGLVWGVTISLMPGESLTLNVGDAFYSDHYSYIEWDETPLNVGIPIYVQVDAWNDADPDSGAILEDHEASGGVYNNIASTTVVADTVRAAPESDRSWNGAVEELPDR